MTGPAPMSASTSVACGTTWIAAISAERVGFGPAGGLARAGQRNFSTSDDDVIYGFHAGAQWQWGDWVLGVEAALSAMLP